jgi:hypothetical protein
VSTRHIARYAAAVFFVFIAGISAWWLNNDHVDEQDEGSKPLEWNIQVIGWLSAILYCGFLDVLVPSPSLISRRHPVGARIPQIGKLDGNSDYYFIEIINSKKS